MKCLEKEEMMERTTEATESGRWGDKVDPTAEAGVHVSHSHLSNSLDSLTVAFNDLEGRLMPVLTTTVSGGGDAEMLKVMRSVKSRTGVEFLIRSLDV